MKTPTNKLAYNMVYNLLHSNFLEIHYMVGPNSLHLILISWFIGFVKSFKISTPDNLLTVAVSFFPRRKHKGI